MEAIVYGMPFIYHFCMLEFMSSCCLANSSTTKLQVMFSTDGSAFPETFYLGAYNMNMY